MSTHKVVFAAVLIIATVLSAKDPNNKPASPSKTAGLPNATLANVNNISSWYESDATHENHPFTGNSGLTFPRATSTAIFTAGLMFGAYSNDGAMAATQPRIVGNSYNSAFTPGAILGTRTGNTEDPSSPDVRIWRIRKDYPTADLLLDAAEMNSTSIAGVTPEMITALRAQYKKDWQEWPASKGAPFYDSNNDGNYSPQFQTIGGIEEPILYPDADEPGLAKADQVIWFVANDIRTGDSPWKTKPLGLEQQVTIWGYKDAGIVGNILFKKIKLIYKGTATTPQNGLLSDAYICHWSDPDLGDYGDDYVGCDTLLSVGFVYNSQTADHEYKKFNMAPPSLGYDFLQGPTVPSPGDTAIIDLTKRAGMKNLPMTSFVYFASGGYYSDPPFSLAGSWQWYSMLQGLPPTPQPSPFPKPIKDPITGDTTKFWLNGDPVTRKGWIDGYWEGPGDRRMLQSSGPFTMALGDTQEIVVGVVGGVGEDYLQSVVAMKENDRHVQAMYNSLFTFIPPTMAVTVTYPSASATVNVKASGTAGQFTSLTANVGGNSLQLFDDGTHNDGASGDGVFANSVAINRSLTPIKVGLTVLTSAGKTFVINNMVERITIAGPVSIENMTINFDNINNDKIINNGEYVRFGATVKNSTSFALKNVRIGYFSDIDFGNERIYGDVAAGTSKSLTYNAYDPNSYFAFRLPMNFANAKHSVMMFVNDDNGNLWKLPYDFTVVQQSFKTDSLVNVATNIIGNNDGLIGYVLFNPAMVGETYDIWYGGTASTKNWTVVKNLSSSDYASVTAALNAKNQVPSITTLPNAVGSGTFTINDQKNQVNYSVTVSGLTGAVTNAHIHAGAAATIGNPVHTMTFAGTSSSGTWAISDTLVDDFTAGNLYVNIHTAANPSGEVRGQIADGLIIRQTLPNPTSLIVPPFSYIENRLVGFSLYVGPAPRGVKTMMQSAPSSGNLMIGPNPENTYRIIDSLNTKWSGSKSNESNVRIQFTAETNWAMAVPFVSPTPTPAQAYPIKVPFAVFKDTTRVFPVVLDRNVDTIWNVIGNGVWNGKPMFDRIVGIVDDRDGSNNNISYYSPAYTTFPPTTTVAKGRIINGINHFLANIFIVNESVNGLPPAVGTQIEITQNKSVKVGDIKSITLKTLGVHIEQLSTVPNDFSLSQNYPNPFNPTTRIEFSLPKAMHATIKVYDVIGREVATLLNEIKTAGRFSLDWNGRNNFNQPVASGVYFYRMEAGNFVQSRKMVVLK